MIDSPLPDSAHKPYQSIPWDLISHSMHEKQDSPAADDSEPPESTGLNTIPAAKEKLLGTDNARLPQEELSHPGRINGNTDKEPDTEIQDVHFESGAGALKDQTSSTERIGNLEASSAADVSVADSTNSRNGGASTKERPNNEPAETAAHRWNSSSRMGSLHPLENGDNIAPPKGISEWSHQQLAPHPVGLRAKEEDSEWQNMPAFAAYDLYDDDGKLIAREAQESDGEDDAYQGLGGAGKGYTRVQLDDDARSATSMDENTSYLFKEKGTNVVDEDEEHRDPLAQMQATKDLLTEGQRIAYVGVTRLAMVGMVKELEDIEGTKGTKKDLRVAVEAMKMWSQKTMVRLYTHMEIDTAGKRTLTILLMEDINYPGRTGHDRATRRARS